MGRFLKGILAATISAGALLTSHLAFAEERARKERTSRERPFAPTKRKPQFKRPTRAKTGSHAEKRRQGAAQAAKQFRKQREIGVDPIFANSAVIHGPDNRLAASRDWRKREREWERVNG